MAADHIPLELRLAPSGPLTRPVILAPAPRQVSFGRIEGRVSSSAVWVVVRAGGRVLASGAPLNGEFRFFVELPRRDVTVRVIAEDGSGKQAVSTVGPVFGLPRNARPALVRTWRDARLSSTVVSLTRAYPGIAAAYVADLRTGAGAAWNARARFPAASTLKLAIALETLRILREKPRPGTRLYKLLRSMLIYSDNAAANALETWIGGSTSGGSARVNALMRSLGIRDSHLFGGYVIGTASRRPIPLRVDKQPILGLGKYTTAYDLARLHRYLHLSAGNKGPLARRVKGRFTPSDGRFLLWLLVHSADHGKLDRFLPPNLAVPHKAGWISTSRHDAGLIYSPGGVFVVAVMTWNASGAGLSSDVLAGRVANRSHQRIKQIRRAAGKAGAPAVAF